MYLVFKEGDGCHACEEALFLAGMKREGHKDVRWTTVMFLFFVLFYSSVTWLTERGKPFFLNCKRNANNMLLTFLKNFSIYDNKTALRDGGKVRASLRLCTQ
jgi:hypothetical protein